MPAPTSGNRGSTTSARPSARRWRSTACRFGDRTGERACAARRERRRQVDHRQAAVRAARARLRDRFDCSASRSAWLSPRAAHRRGIQTAFQEMTLVRDLTVLDNMLLPYAPVDCDRHDPPARRPRRTVARAFRPARLDDIDLRDEVRDARSRRPAEDRDRPRASSASRASCCSTSRPRPCRAATSIGWARSSRREKARGVTIVFISHRLREVRALLRHADDPAQRPAHRDRQGRRSERRRGDRMIIGRSLGQTFPPRPPASARHGREVLRRRRARTAGKLRDASFVLHAGRDPRRRRAAGHGPARPVPRLLRHDATLRRGQIHVDGQPVSIDFARRCGARQYRHQPRAGGPQDRGAVPQAHRQAQRLAAGDRPLLPLRPDRRRARDRGGRAGLRPRRGRPSVRCGRGSAPSPAATSRRSRSPNGCSPRAASCCSIDPTRGIDVGTKHELYRADARLRRGGRRDPASIRPRFPSSSISRDRVLVLYAGRVVDGDRQRTAHRGRDHARRPWRADAAGRGGMTASPSGRRAPIRRGSPAAPRARYRGLADRARRLRRAARSSTI